MSSSSSGEDPIDTVKTTKSVYYDLVRVGTYSTGVWSMNYANYLQEGVEW